MAEAAERKAAAEEPEGDAPACPGGGLGGAVRTSHSRWVLHPTCLMPVVANVVTIGADLGGMAAASS